MIALALAVRGIDSTPPELHPPVALAAAEVRSFADDGARDVVISIAESPAPSLRAPDWSGVVGAVYAQPGQTVVSGTAVALVGGVVVTAIHTEVPFVRSLSVGAAGSDVKALQLVLRDLGFDPGEASGKYNNSTAKAVMAWRTVLGDLTPTGAFDPAFVVWLPTPSLDVDVVALGIAESAPAAGQPIILGAPTYDVVVFDGGSRNVLNPLPVGYTVDVGATSLGALANSGFTERQMEQLVELARSAAQTNGAAAQPGSTSGPLELNAVLKLSTKLVQRVVPAGAVIQGHDGEGTCVLVISDGSFLAFATQVVGGSLGVVYVNPAPPDGTKVVVNPAEIAPTQSC